MIRTLTAFAAGLAVAALFLARPGDAAARQNPLLLGQLQQELQTVKAQLAAFQNAKYAHYSVWKRRPFVPQRAADAFADDVYGALAKEGSVRGAWVGPTSVPETAGGEIALLLLFDDRDGHKQYLEDATTKRFSEKHGRRWEMVKALDVLAK